MAAPQRGADAILGSEMRFCLDVLAAPKRAPSKRPDAAHPAALSR